nr:MAG TPA: hypothetical protein [Caudoviricetes sp.]
MFSYTLSPHHHIISRILNIVYSYKKVRTCFSMCAVISYCQARKDC